MTVAKAKKKADLPRGLYWKGPTIYARDPRDGKYRSTKTSDPKAAEALLARWRAEAWNRDQGFEARAAAERKATMADLAKSFRSKKKDKKSLASDEWKLARIVAHFGTRPVTSIPLRDYEAFLDGLQHQGAPVAPSTWNRWRALLQTMLGLALTEKVVSENPIKHIARRKEENERDRIATAEEHERILAEADPELRSLIVVANATGMRLSEILSIRPNMIALDRRIIRLGYTKSGKKRTVPIAREALPVFENFKGWKSNSAAITKRFKALTTRLGITDLRFHDYRHRACTRMRRAGVDVMTLATISGHESLVVLQRYMKIDEADQVKAVDQLAPDPS